MQWERWPLVYREQNIEWCWKKRESGLEVSERQKIKMNRKRIQSRRSPVSWNDGNDDENAKGERSSVRWRRKCAGMKRDRLPSSKYSSAVSQHQRKTSRTSTATCKRCDSDNQKRREDLLGGILVTRRRGNQSGLGQQINQGRNTRILEPWDATEEEFWGVSSLQPMNGFNLMGQ